MKVIKIEKIKEIINQYQKEYDLLKENYNKAFKNHMDYCSRNTHLIPRPSYKTFVDNTQNQMLYLSIRISTLEKLIEL